MTSVTWREAVGGAVEIGRTLREIEDLLRIAGAASVYKDVEAPYYIGQAVTASRRLTRHLSSLEWKVRGE